MTKPVSAEAQAIVDARDQERDLAKKDRLYLANKVLGYDFQEETHKELFDLYPPFDEKKPWADQFPVRNILVLWPRGHFKTTALVVITIQAILNFPDIRIVLMQGSSKVTKNFLREIASHFLGEAQRSRLGELFPWFCGSRKKLNLTTEQMTTPARKKKQLPQATITVASPRTLKTGQHYDLGIFDDLVNDQNYRSPTLLQKVREDFDMCFPLIDPGCPRFVSGTRYAFGDLYETLIRRSMDAEGKDRGEWIISVKTCWLGDNAESGIRFKKFTGKDGNTHGYTLEILQQILRDNPGMFASQYLNRPVLESQQIISERDMAAALVVPKYLPMLSNAYIFVDLSMEGKTEPDDSVILVGKTDSRGIMYVVDGAGGAWLIPQLANQVIYYAMHYMPIKVLIEETGPAKYFFEYIRMVCRDKGINLPLDFIKVDNRKNAKEIRIKTMAGHVKNGRCKFFPGLRFWDKLVEQTTQYTGGKHHRHDDYPDTVALMCSQFAGTYLSILTNRITPPTRHPIVDLLSRDPVSQIIPNEDDFSASYLEETMGEEFA